MSLKIIENAVDKKSFDQIYKLVIKDDFPYFLGLDSGEYTLVEDIEKLRNSTVFPTKNGFITPQLSHCLVLNEEVNSPYAEIFIPIIIQIMKNNNIEGYIHKAKINLLLNNSEVKTEDTHNMPHVDNDKKHVSLLLYLNDSDGDTVVFNERYKDKFKSLTVMEKIKPQANKLLVIDNHFHASTNPIKSGIRIVLNVVIFIK